MNLAPPNYTQVPNALLDQLANFSANEVVLLMFICRQTFGWHKASDKLTLAAISRGTGMKSHNTVKKVLESLIGQNVVRARKAPQPYRGQTIYFYSLNLDELTPSKIDRVEPPTLSKNDRVKSATPSKIDRVEPPTLSKNDTTKESLKEIKDKEREKTSSFLKSFYKKKYQTYIAEGVRSSAWLNLSVQTVKNLAREVQTFGGHPHTALNKLLDEQAGLGSQGVRDVPGGLHEAEYNRAERAEAKARLEEDARESMYYVIEEMKMNGINQDEANQFGDAMYQHKVKNNTEMIDKLEEQIRRRVLSAQAQALNAQELA